MRSDVINILEPELSSGDSGKDMRLFAYATAISRTEGGVSSKRKAKVGSGVSGLMKELEKTMHDV